MRQLALTETNTIAGGYIGETKSYDFALKPGVEVVGFDRVTVDYDIIEVIEKGLFSSTVTYIETPIYAYYPVYSATYTY